MRVDPDPDPVITENFMILDEIVEHTSDIILPPSMNHQWSTVKKAFLQLLPRNSFNLRNRVRQSIHVIQPLSLDFDCP